MSQIPKPRLPEPLVDPKRDRVRFDLRHLRRTGDYSRKAFGKLPEKRRKLICCDLRGSSHMTLLQFRSSNGVRLQNRKLPGFKPPEALSEDVKDQLWQYFRLSRKARVFGFLLSRTFFVVMIDPDHGIKV
jgi:hypothetical protein